jgi:pimeloyl-ACP methyl ester carboxylesterase
VSSADREDAYDRSVSLSAAAQLTHGGLVERRDSVVDLDDGRTLEVTEGGDFDGFPVVVHHGTPASRALLSGWVDDATARGIRLVSYNRPGYGGSTPQPGRTVGDAAADVAALTEALGIERFASWGLSGGGPHVLACAALLPERVAAAASIASAAPYDADGLDFLAGMGEDNVTEFTAARDDPRALESLLQEWRVQLLGGDAEAIIASMRTILSPVDAAVMSTEVGELMVAWTSEGLAQGIEGWRDDDLAFTRPWGFRVEDITVPVALWQGAQDLMVPFAHGQWLAEHIPDVEPHLLSQEGHLTLLVGHVAQVHGWLLARNSGHPAPTDATPPT